MKLSVIGGAGVRAPLLIGSFAKRAKAIDLHEIAVYDIDPVKIKRLVPLARTLLEKAGNPFKLTVADSFDEAVAGSRAVITTIREGFENGRAKDERICHELGTVGQETTGAAGFAYACRSIPVLTRYAHRLFDKNPEAWLINFTNPAGMVAEALFKSGFERVVGICDSAEGAKSYAADVLGLPKSRLETRVAGLNHLSFTTSLKADGKERLPELLANPDFLHKSMIWFDPACPAEYGAYLNEYLYYFLEKEKALASLLAEKETRGEKILRLNAELLGRLGELLDQGDREAALAYFFAYQRKRNESYMEYARSEERYLPSDDEEGYAGVAIEFLEALTHGNAAPRAYCVPNGATFPELPKDGVIEVTCKVAQGKLTPIAPEPALTPKAMELIKAVKRYETLGVDSIMARDFGGAIEALTVHPLIERPDLASQLMLAFKAAAPKSFEDWR